MAMKIMPSQNEGSDCRKMKNESTPRSAACPRRQAAKTPKTTPRTVDSARLLPVSSSVHGKRSARISPMGRFWRYE
ncbi:MAG: hypothetical protein R2856_35945 [Caldilineaceae bacterium]